MFKEKFKELQQKLNIKRRDIVAIIISILIASIFFLGYQLFGDRFNNLMWTITGIILIVFVYLIMFIAGFAVMKALFFVAAELSLLIFLAQSYCNVQTRPVGSDEALQSLLIIGMTYIIYSFFRSLLDICKKHYQPIKNERRSSQKIVTISLFIFFAGVFAWQIYLVVSPIVKNLCVYK